MKCTTDLYMLMIIIKLCNLLQSRNNIALINDNHQ